MNVLTQRIFPSAWLVLLFKAPLSTCGWNEEINTSPAQGLPFLKKFIRLTVFSLSFFTSPHLWSIKEPGIQTQRRWLFWVINLPSSYSASYPSKVTFLASAPILLDLQACHMVSRASLPLATVSFKNIHLIKSYYCCLFTFSDLLSQYLEPL